MERRKKVEDFGGKLFAGEHWQGKGVMDDNAFEEFIKQREMNNHFDKVENGSYI
jgi:hypothetical protein